LNFIQDIEARVNARFRRVVSQYFAAQIMDRADSGGVQPVLISLPPAVFFRLQVGLGQVTADVAPHPVPHFTGRFAGKGDSHNLAQGQPIGQQREVAGYQRPGLARSRSGGHNHIVNPCLNGLLLGRAERQVGQNIGHSEKDGGV
jgi:hypothetical protein